MAMMQRALYRFNRFIPLARPLTNLNQSPKDIFSQQSNKHQNRERSENTTQFIFYATVSPFLAFFKKKEEEEGETEEDGTSFLEKILPDDVMLLFKKIPEQDESTDEGKLKTTLKRTILCIYRGEYKKAEQMGHLALRMAQDMQHYDGITFVYDILGNLAYETAQYEKAENLFTSVLQRLIQKEVPLDDIRVLHLSLKVAQMIELQNKIDEAHTSYIWTIKNIEEKHKKLPDDPDLHELWGLANNLYGKFLLSNGKFKEAKERLLISHDIYVRFRGRNDPEFINILNDLSVACSHTNDLETAESYINEALILVAAFPDMYESGIYHANKGMIFFRKGLIKQAEQMCIYANKLAKRSNDADGLAQAKYCLDEIEKAMKEPK